MHQQRLADDVARGHARVERGERVLEDDLHLPAEPAAFGLAQGDVGAADRMLPTSVRPGAARRGLAVVDLPQPDSPTRPSVSPTPMRS